MLDQRVSMDIPATGKNVNGYRFLKEISRGGYGITYLVEGSDKVFYIVKELYPINYEGFYVRNEEGLLISKDADGEKYKKTLEIAIQQELAMSDRINHDSSGAIGVENTNSPYIFKSERLDFESVKTDVPYIKIATTSGHTLKEELDGNISIVESVNIIKKVYDALKLGLHNRNIVHGDLKLENIYVTGGNIKLIDFGSSYVMGEYSRERLFSGCGFSYSGLYASSRVKRLSDSLADIQRCKIRDVSEEEVYSKMEQAYALANTLSAYEDLYSLYAMTFYMLVGCYPFQGSLEELDDIYDVIKFCDFNNMTKRLLWAMTEAFANESVEYVEKNFEDWIDSMISSVTSGMKLYELINYAHSNRDKFNDIKRNFDKRYTQGSISNIVLSSNGTYEYSAGNVKKYNELVNELKKLDNDKKTYVINGNAEMGKTWFCKNLVCDLYDKFIIQGLIPMYYERLSEEIYKKLKKEAYKSCWFKTFCIIEASDMSLEDIDSLCDSGIVLIERNDSDEVDREYCYKNNVSICRYSFNEDILRTEAERYNAVLDKKFNLNDDFYKNPYIITLLKDEFDSTGNIKTTNKRILIENNIDFKLSKYEKTKKILDHQALNYANQRLLNGNIVEKDIEMCKPLVDCNLMALNMNYENNNIIKFVDGYYGPYYVAREIIELYNQDHETMSIQCTNKEAEMLACFIDADEKLGLEEICKFISGGEESKEYAFNLVNLYRYSNVAESITIRNIDFRGLWELEYYLTNLDKKIVFENCIFSQECFSCDDSMVRVEGDNCSYSKIGFDWKYEQGYYLRHNNKWAKPVLFDEGVYHIFSNKIVKDYVANQKIVTGYEKNNGKNDLSKPLTRIKSVLYGTKDIYPHETILDYSVDNKLYFLVEINGKNYYTTYKENEIDNWKNKWIPDNFPCLKPVSLEVNNSMIVIGYGSKEDYNRIKGMEYPGWSKRYARINRLSYGFIVDGKVNKWMIYNGQFDAINIFTMNISEQKYVVICKDREIDFYNCDGNELKLVKRHKVDRYDYCISDGKETIAIGRSSSNSLEILDCSEITAIEIKSYNLNTFYAPYSLGLVDGGCKEFYVSTVYNKKVGHCIVCVNKYAVSKNRANAIQPHWFYYDYYNCTFYQSIISDKKDYSFYEKLIQELIEMPDPLYSEKMKYAMRGLLDDSQLEIDKVGLLEVLVYVYIVLNNKQLCTKIISSYKDLIGCDIEKMFMEDDVNKIINTLLIYISSLTCDVIVENKYVWINNVVLGIANKKRDELDKGEVLYGISELVYDLYQSIAKNNRIPIDKKDEHFDLALGLCEEAKELGNKNATKTWNEYMLYGAGKTKTLVFY